MAIQRDDKALSAIINSLIDFYETTHNVKAVYFQAKEVDGKSRLSLHFTEVVRSSSAKESLHMCPICGWQRSILNSHDNYHLKICGNRDCKNFGALFTR